MYTWFAVGGIFLLRFGYIGGVGDEMFENKLYGISIFIFICIYENDFPENIIMIINIRS